MKVEELMHTAISAGLGTAMSAGVSQFVANLAQELRRYAETLAQEIEAFEKESESITAQLNSMDAVKWVSEAASNFRVTLESERNQQQEAERSLADAAAKTRIAGESLAQELEALSGSIAQAGAAVDTQVKNLETKIDNTADVLNHHSVITAQSSLEALVRHPLISSIQNALRGGRLS